MLHKRMYHLAPAELTELKAQRMYRLDTTKLIEVKAQVTDLLERALIEPSTSAYGSPILFVKKKTGELKMVVDHRVLNKLTIKNRYPLPRADDLFYKLHGAKCVTSCWFSPNIVDRAKTAFRTPFGHQEFKVLPFGLTNAPATVKTVMNKSFNPPHFGKDGKPNTGPQLSNSELVFIDDILIFSKTAKDNIINARHLEVVF